MPSNLSKGWRIWSSVALSYLYWNVVSFIMSSSLTFCFVSVCCLSLREPPHQAGSSWLSASKWVNVKKIQTKKASLNGLDFITAQPCLNADCDKGYFFAANSSGEYVLCIFRHVVLNREGKYWNHLHICVQKASLLQGAATDLVITWPCSITAFLGLKWEFEIWSGMISCWLML